MLRLIVIYAIIICCLGCNSLGGNLQKLKSEHAQDRVDAISWLYHNSKSDTNKKLLQEALTKDQSPLVRSLAVRLMVLSKDSEYVPVITNSLYDAEYLVRMEVVQALGSFQDKKSIPILWQKFKTEKHPWVRMKILKTLDYMQSKESIAFFVEALNDEEPSIQLQAVDILQKITGQNLGINKNAWLEWLKTQKT